MRLLVSIVAKEVLSDVDLHMEEVEAEEEDNQ